MNSRSAQVAIEGRDQRVCLLGLRLNAPGAVPDMWYRRNAIAYPLFSYTVFAFAAYLSKNDQVSALFARRAVRELPRFLTRQGDREADAVEAVRTFLCVLVGELEFSPTVSPDLVDELVLWRLQAPNKGAA